MGYDITQGETSIRIERAQQGAARRAAQALLSPDDRSLQTSGVIRCGPRPVHEGRWFAFMMTTMQAFAEATTLAEVLAAWHWTPTVAADGTITAVRYTLSRLDDSYLLWQQIGPYIAAGSSIAMTGEDGAAWVWVFDGSGCTLQVIVPSDEGPSWLRHPTDEDMDTAGDLPWSRRTDQPELWR